MVDSSEERSIPNSTSSVEHHSDDPKPPSSHATDEELQDYQTRLEKYADDVYAYLVNDETITGRTLWTDLTTTFSSLGIRHLCRTTAFRWRALLITRDVYVRRERNIRVQDALIECLERDVFISESSMNRVYAPREDNASQPRSLSQTKLAQNRNQNKRTIATKDTSEVDMTIEKNGGVTNSMNGSDFSHKSGVNTIAKLWHGRKKFTGALDEDLIGVLQQYESFALSCNMSKEEMARGIPVILDGEAMSFYSSSLTGVFNYDRICEFTSDEQRSRLLTIWQKTSLSAEFDRNPDSSQLAVFKSVCRLLKRTQRQLHVRYHEDIFLKDQLVQAADIPDITRSMLEKPPQTAHEAQERIAALLSADPKSAGMHIAKHSDIVNYGFNRKFGGDAVHRKHNKKYSHHRKPHKRGCVVCQKDHFARNNHSQDEIIAAIRRKKKNCPNHVYTVQQFTEALDVFDSSSSSDESSGDESGSDDSDQQVNLAAEENITTNTRLEQHLANNAFCHGAIIVGKSEMQTTDEALSVSDCGKFRGIIMDPGCNRRSVMSLSQYRSYCDEFDVIASINTSKAGTLRGIGDSRSHYIGTAIIAIPFQQLGLTIDVEFGILNAECFCFITA